MVDVKDPWPIPSEYRDAHEHSGNHFEELGRSVECACFYCRHRFSPGEIRQWIKRKLHSERTALCPKCGIDAVLGDASGFALTNQFLDAMQLHWFRRGYTSRGERWEGPE